MNTLDCIKTRRSIRRFKPEAVSHEIIENIIYYTTYSPSWKNSFVPRFIAIEDSELINTIASNYVPDFNKPRIITAPLLMVVTAIKNRSGFERDGSFSTEKGDRWTHFDSGIASQTLCLAAHEYGLGSVILGLYDAKGITELLQIPDDREIIALIPMGYPDEAPEAPKRRAVADVLEYK
ncbi:MAG: nitroreductase [Lachnospira sp.]|nr:nitroreductase [Lachnospira sp.]